MRRTLIPVSLAAVIALAAWTIAARAADKDRDWPAYGGDKGGTKYSLARSDQQGHDQEPEDRLAHVRHARGAEGRRSPTRRPLPTTSTRR